MLSYSSLNQSDIDTYLEKTLCRPNYWENDIHPVTRRRLKEVGWKLYTLWNRGQTEKLERQRQLLFQSTEHQDYTSWRIIYYNLQAFCISYPVLFTGMLSSNLISFHLTFYSIAIKYGFLNLILAVLGWESRGGIFSKGGSKQGSTACIN